MFEEYYEKIENLVCFEKIYILNKDFELYNDGKMSIYYAPHNETRNEKAKIFLIGITPGWTQTQIAFKTAQKGIRNCLSKEETKRECKRNARFAGSMRKNLIEMLEELQLHKYLNISSCAKLFAEKDYLMHTTSMLPYPVFINGKNYTGSSPKILNNKVLTSYVQRYFYEEAKAMQNALFIPLGHSVTEVLEKMVQEGLLEQHQCLFGFPHPSGANGHRKKQFEEKKKKRFVKCWHCVMAFFYKVDGLRATMNFLRRITPFKTIFLY